MGTPFYPIWIEAPCANGHIFLWHSGGTGETHPPKGVTCQCGLLIADGNGGTIIQDEYHRKCLDNMDILTRGGIYNDVVATLGN